MDLESGSRLSTEPWHVAREYREQMAAFTERLRRECRQSLVDYVLLDTATPFHVALANYLAKRRRLL